MTPETARRMIEAYGADRVLFGTDYPMWDPAEELERLRKIGLCEEDLQKILYQNAAKLLGL